MKRWHREVVLLLAGMATAVVSAQPGQGVSFDTLTRSPQATTGTVREIRLTWQVTTSPNQPVPTDVFTLADERRSPGPLKRDRLPQLSSNQIVVMVLDAGGSVVDWRLVRNPRIARAEAPQQNGRLSGRVVELPTAELWVAVADVAGARTLRFARPRWNGKEYLLDAVGNDVMLAQ